MIGKAANLGIDYKTPTQKMPKAFFVSDRQQSTVNSQQSTVNSQQSTVNSQQSTVNSQLYTIFKKQSQLHISLFSNYQLFTL